MFSFLETETEGIIPLCGRQNLTQTPASRFGESGGVRASGPQDSNRLVAVSSAYRKAPHNLKLGKREVKITIGPSCLSSLSCKGAGSFLVPIKAIERLLHLPRNDLILEHDGFFLSLTISAGLFEQVSILSSYMVQEN